MAAASGLVYLLSLQLLATDIAFRWRAPCGQDVAMSVGTQTSSGIPLRAATVLVVEDEPLVRTAITEYLRDSGFRVLEAG